MHYTTALAGLATLVLAAPALAAPTEAGNVFVNNHCGAPVWITAVDSLQGPTIKVENEGTWVQKQHVDPKTGGTAVKIVANERGLYNGSPVLHYSYSLSVDGLVYYDLNTIFNFDPLFQGKKLVIHGAQNCPVVQWTGAPIPPPDTKACAQGTDLTLELCAP